MLCLYIFVFSFRFLPDLSLSLSLSLSLFSPSQPRPQRRTKYECYRYTVASRRRPPKREKEVERSADLRSCAFLQHLLQDGSIAAEVHWFTHCVGLRRRNERGEERERERERERKVCMRKSGSSGEQKGKWSVRASNRLESEPRLPLLPIVLRCR